MSKFIEHFTDAGMSEKFCEGDLESIREISKIAGNLLLKHGEFREKYLIDLFSEILLRIGNGESPNDAFGWTQGRKGRRVKHTEFRDWDVKMTVRELLRSGFSLPNACDKVCSENNGDFTLSRKTIENICKGLSKDTEIASFLEENIFPIDNRYRKGSARN